MKRLTYEVVKLEFEKAGYELLESTYKNNKIKMKFKCPYHPDKETSITYKQLVRGEGCAYCSGNVKKTIEEVRLEFEKAGYELLETEYVNSHTPMKYRCPFHPNEDTLIRLSDLKRGDRCSYCYYDSLRLSYEEVKLEFENRGYILLEDKYLNANTKMRYLCPHHPDKNLSIEYFRLQQGQGCLYCSGKGRKTYLEVKQEFEDRGYILKETEYKGVKQELNFTCNKHPDFKQDIAYLNFQRGHGCKVCGWEDSINKRRGENHYRWKGGVSSISEFLRHKINDWKFDSLKQYGFKCAITGEFSSKLQVHHTKAFYEIRDEVLKELGISVRASVNKYSEEELERIVNRLKEKHKDVVGIPLLKKIHDLFHSLYGQKGTSLNDFLEFESRYRNGEFQI